MVAVVAGCARICEETGSAGIAWAEPNNCGPARVTGSGAGGSPKSACLAPIAGVANWPGERPPSVQRATVIVSPTNRTGSASIARSARSDGLVLVSCRQLRFMPNCRAGLDGRACNRPLRELRSSKVVLAFEAVGRRLRDTSSGRGTTPFRLCVCDLRFFCFFTAARPTPESPGRTDALYRASCW